VFTIYFARKTYLHKNKNKLKIKIKKLKNK